MNKKETAELIGDLIFAYVNKDADFPHDYEVNPITKACDYYLKNGGSKYSDRFINWVKNSIARGE